MNRKDLAPRELDERVTLYLLDELDPDERKSVEESLLASPELREEFEARKRTLELLRGQTAAGAAGLTAAERDEIWSSVHTGRVASRRTFRPATAWSTAATILIFLGLGWLFVISNILGPEPGARRVAQELEPNSEEKPSGQTGDRSLAAKLDGSSVVGGDDQGRATKKTPMSATSTSTPDSGPGRRLDENGQPSIPITPDLSVDSVVVPNEQLQRAEKQQILALSSEPEHGKLFVAPGAEATPQPPNDAFGVSGAATGAYGGRTESKSPPATRERRRGRSSIQSYGRATTPAPAPSPTLPARGFSAPAAESPPADQAVGLVITEDVGEVLGEDGTTLSPEARITEILARLRRHPGETPDMMFFRYWGDNPFVRADRDPQSTFGVDVDTASYTLTRNYLRNGNVPPKAAIRTEEFVNYFPSNYPTPTKTALGLRLELAPSYFSHQDGVYLLKVGVKAREVAAQERKPLDLTLVIDVSGSMRRENRLELVKQAILTLLNEMNSGDRVGIVVFESTAREILDTVPASDVDAITTALRGLQPGSSTNVEQGLELGYGMALRHLRPDVNTVVALFSDGVANVGNVAAEQILKKAVEARGEGVTLMTFGVGMGNHNDALLEQLADKGDGRCAYIDTYKEAVRLFRKNLTGSFEVVARDAKIQVEFDPRVVTRYRQLGYENRAIADADFRNDKIDAGEVGAGHEVVALYEVEMRQKDGLPPAVARLRYKDAANGEIVELEEKSPADGVRDFHDAAPRFRLSASVAAFAEVLRDSYWARSTSLADVIEVTQNLLVLDQPGDDRIAELVALMRQAEGLVAARHADELSQAIDEVKRNQYLQVRLEDLRDHPVDGRDADWTSELERLRQQNDALEQRLRNLLRGG